MNNIFIKNLSALKAKNQELAARLENYVPTELAIFSQENGFYNLLYKNKFIHNKANPLLEAQLIFSQLENTPTSIHIVYGLGLGYLFQIVSSKSKGAIILFEPDLNILWIAFTLVDFSNDILKKNVYVVNTVEDLSRVIYEKSGTKNTPQLISLPTQREYNLIMFNEIVKKIQDLVGSFVLDLKFSKEKLYPAMIMLLQNIPLMLNEIPLAHYKDFFKGKTAVVVSAGPTLDKNIKVLKENRDKYVLFCVGTALKTLYSNGLKPDFLVVIETYNSSRQLEGLDLSEVNFITEPYSHPDLRKFKFKQRVSHISANMPVNHLWAELCNENIEEYWSKGTVSFTALNCARLLGCSKIVLVGQDLAYIEGQCYSKDSIYKDLFCGINPESGRWEIMAKDFEKFSFAISPSENVDVRRSAAKRRLQNLNRSLHLVKGINGDMIPTESVYATFVTPLVEFAKKYNDRDYINTSLVGAQIDGYKNVPLEEALKDSEPVGEVSLISTFEYDKVSILDKLDLEIQQLKSVENLLDEAERVLKSLFNNLKRCRSVSTEVLKSLKRISIIYAELSDTYTKKSKIYDFISVQDRVDVDYLIKMTENFTIENITEIVDKLKILVINSKNRIARIKEIQRGLNESFNTKS